MDEGAAARLVFEAVYAADASEALRGRDAEQLLQVGTGAACFELNAHALRACG